MQPIRRYPAIALFLVCSAACSRPGVMVEGKHVPIGGPATTKQKVALAKAVLARLPAEKIRGEVHLRFPALSNQQLKNIVVGSTVLTMRDENNREEVHLYVDIYENPRIVNTDEVQNYVADLFEEELRRQMAAASLSATSSSSP